MEYVLESDNLDIKAPFAYNEILFAVLTTHK
jgi:hypothetical protein